MEKNTETKEEVKAEIRRIFNTFSYYGSASHIKGDAKRILELMDDLKQLGEPGCGTAYVEFAHTVGKELEWAISAEKAMNKKNAPKVRQTDYYKSLEWAIDLMDMDLAHLLSDNASHE